jgi:hypothetical protein
MPDFHDWDIKHLQAKILNYYKPLKTCRRGNVLWMLMQGENNKYTQAFLLRKDRHVGWEAADLGDGTDSNYYTCPTSYLEDADDKGTFYAHCKERQKDIGKRLKQSFKIKKDVRVGDIVQLPWKAPAEGIVISIEPLRVQDPQGNKWRIRYRSIRKWIHRVSREEHAKDTGTNASSAS